jgi:hypothetical protein
MRTSEKMYCLGLALLAAINISPNALAEDRQDTSKSCRTFVQGFYDWYAAEANKDTPGDTSDIALKYKRSVFSPVLFKKLKEDSDAQAKVSGEIVGLDFDPFLATNSTPYKKYVVGNVLPKGQNHYLVQICGIEKGKKVAGTIVTPEVAMTGGRWTFVNFRYGNSKIPENENLLSILTVLKKDRQKYPN